MLKEGFHRIRRFVDTMPEGIFFLMNDRKREPEIKCSYFNHMMDIPPEFVSKLYAAHANFGFPSFLQMKFDHYRVLSYSTGHLLNQTQREGIIGLILEEEEKIGNLELFVRRNLNLTLNRPDNQIMQEIFKQCRNYLNLDQLFEKVKFENISEIIIVSGTDKFKSNLLRLGKLTLLNSEITSIYEAIMKKEAHPHFQYTQLNVDPPNKVFLILTGQKSEQTIDQIISAIKPFLEKFFYYSLEIFAMFLLTPNIKIVPSKSNQINDAFHKNKSVLNLLQETSNYYETFDKMIRSITTEDNYLASIV